MPTPRELEEKLWKTFKSDTTVILGLEDLEDSHTRQDLVSLPCRLFVTCPDTSQRFSDGIQLEEVKRSRFSGGRFSCRDCFRTVEDGKGAFRWEHSILYELLDKRAQDYNGHSGVLFPL
jgi:hypothetical protein